MTAKEFWEDDPALFWSYRISYMQKKKNEQIVQNLFFSEEFKKCSACGRTLLKSPRNFVRKSRSKDGYANKCKYCDNTKKYLELSLEIVNND